MRGLKFVDYYCSEHGSMVCPSCGSPYVKIEYKGKEPDLLALTKRDDFCCFVGCLRVDLHDKVVDGVDYRGKVIFRPVFRGREWKMMENERKRRTED